MNFIKTVQKNFVSFGKLLSVTLHQVWLNVGCPLALIRLTNAEANEHTHDQYTSH